MTTMQIVGASLFAIAPIHTFSTQFFEWMAHHRPDHSGLRHMLGEVEAVFGFWAMVLMFAIVVIAGSRAVLDVAKASVHAIARLVPLQGGMAFCFVALSFLPLLGALITELAAMTLAAMVLRDRISEPESLQS